MNVETFKLIVAGIIVTIAFCVLGWQVVESYRAGVSSKRRAEELLLAVLTTKQYNQLTKRGYIDIHSQRDQERVYRVPRAGTCARKGEGNSESLPATA
jgi:hypothetical protein